MKKNHKNLSTEKCIISNRWIKYWSIGENLKRWNKRDKAWNNWTNKAAAVNACVEKKWDGTVVLFKRNTMERVLLTNRIRELCLNKMNKTVVRQAG